MQTYCGSQRTQDFIWWWKLWDFVGAGRWEPTHQTEISLLVSCFMNVSRLNKQTVYLHFRKKESSCVAVVCISVKFFAKWPRCCFMFYYGLFYHDEDLVKKITCNSNNCDPNHLVLCSVQLVCSKYLNSFYVSPVSLPSVQVQVDVISASSRLLLESMKWFQLGQNRTFCSFLSSYSKPPIYYRDILPFLHHNNRLLQLSG